ncbi:MAG: exodeoxyribonuclease V subunit gamma [Bacteroidales bacterium]|nr:exodeoxyribonuclease V subunit gamma [Bacteroidales bacterium]MDD4029985.1 exodeoxyribonuclease V subunit gamma [Bacteroidales bacterium]MDD4434760.1 exodeoxyribonuclease V subunit gamma [Bacteroidales bacterium]
MAAVIYVSDQLEILCDKLAQNMARTEGLPESAERVFLPDILITQTAGMESWLSTELAGRNGVFANFRFLKQDQLLEEIYTTLSGKKRYTAGMRAALFELLGSESFTARFPDIAAYYCPHKQNSQLRRMQLAGKVADLFDQYQVYRTDMMSSWEDTAHDPVNLQERLRESSPAGCRDTDHGVWQRWLWNSMRNNNPRFCSKHQMQAWLLEKLEDRQCRPAVRRVVPRLSLFGLSIFTTFHNQVFEKLARVIDVDYYLVFPSEQFLVNKRFSNPLSAALGMKYAEMAALLPRECQVVPLWGQYSGDTLLGKFKNTLRRDQVPLAGMLEESDLGDGTLVINVCYTPVREVEVFYNYLAGLMQDGAGLKPHDVLVLLPDVETYAPYIKAVFGNAPYHIPFFIGGESLDQQESIAGTLLTLMGFDALDDFTAEEVISLLEIKRIAQKYEITNLQYLRDAVEALNIRFGLENRLEDDTRFVSWQYGFEKIMMGFAILSTKPIASSQGSYTVFPWPEAETSGAYDLLRLKSFLDHLSAYARKKEEVHTFGQWKTFLLEEVLEQSVAYSDKDEMELDNLYRRMENLERSYGETPLSFELIHHLVADSLVTDTRTGMYLSGRVTFMPIIPGRGIPKRVIALLGLNGNVFPRKDTTPGFDLLREEPRLGDRSKKENDKLVFLESLVAARDYLYISYIGRDVKDNRLLPPSIVLDELTETLESLAPEGCRDKIRCGIQRVHPLHGFSSRYDGQDQRLFTYLLANEPENPENPGLPQPDMAGSTIPETVQLESVALFFTHPLKWYYQNILGIRYDEPRQSLTECEIFDLDHLQQWQLKRFLVQADPVAEEELIATWTDQAMKEGNMPLARIKELEVKEAQQEIESLQQAWLELTGNKTGVIWPVETAAGGFTITGAVNNIYSGVYCDFSTSTDNIKGQVKTRIRHLALCAGGFSGPAVLLDLQGKQYRLHAMGKEQAGRQLSRLMELFRLGCENRLPFTLKTAGMYSSTEEPHAWMKKAMRQIKIEAEGSYQSEADPYVALAWKEGVFDTDRHDFMQQIIKEFSELILVPWQT